VNFKKRIAFYTKNGELLDAAFWDLMLDTQEQPKKSDIYPAIGFYSSGAHVYVNFGQKPFLFKIEEYLMYDLS
jgi:Ran-binding protein 9/10